jgi:hypothetical protein
MNGTVTPCSLVEVHDVSVRRFASVISVRLNQGACSFLFAFQFNTENEDYEFIRYALKLGQDCTASHFPIPKCCFRQVVTCVDAFERRCPHLLRLRLRLRLAVSGAASFRCVPGDMTRDPDPLSQYIACT